MKYGSNHIYILHWNCNFMAKCSYLGQLLVPMAKNISEISAMVLKTNDYQ